MTTPTADQIRGAAATSPEAKAALMRLFPEVFAPKALSTENVNRKALHEAFRDTPLRDSIYPAIDNEGLFLINLPGHTWTVTPTPWGRDCFLRCIPISD